MRMRSLILALLMLIVSRPLFAAGETPVRIAYPSGMNGMIVKVMERAKIAEKHGLQPTYHFFQYGPEMMEALTAESVDIVVTAVVPVTSYLQKNPGSAVIFANLGHSFHGLVAQPGIGATDIRGLKGRSIAVSFNSESHADLLVALKAAGMDASRDVTLLNIAPNELAPLFQSKQADAVVIRQPQLQKLEQSAQGKVLARWPFRFIAIARKDFLDKNPAVVAKAQEALRQSIFYIATHVDETSQWFGEHLRLDPGFVKRVAFEDPNFTAKRIEDINVRITPDYRKYLQDRSALCEELKFVKKKPELLFYEGR